MNAPAGLTEVRVPDLGNFKDVAVIDVLVKPGDTIAVDTPLLTLESDKAAMDVPSTASGVVEKVHTARGGKVNPGDLIVTLKGGAAAGAAPPPAAAAAAAKVSEPPAAAGAATESRPAAAQAASPPAAAAAEQATPAAAAGARAGRMVPRSQLGAPTSYRPDLAPIDEPGFSRAHASPSVRAFARELGVDLARVAGQGFKGRITHEDIKAFVKGALAGAPGEPAAAAAPPATSRSSAPSAPSR